MGVFSGISTPVEEIQTGVRIKPGSYEFQITDVTFMEFDEEHESMPNQQAIIFELTVVDGEASEIGKKFSSFNRIPNEEAQGEKADMFASILKQNMIAFGIPEAMLDQWDPEEQDDLDAIIGGVGTGTIRVNKKNKDYDNLYNFKLTEESGVSTLGDTPSGEADTSLWK